MSGLPWKISNLDHKMKHKNKMIANKVVACVQIFMSLIGTWHASKIFMP